MSKKNSKKVGIRVGRSGDGSPIETRSQARGIVNIDQPKRRSKNGCRRKGRQGNPRNREW